MTRTEIEVLLSDAEQSLHQQFSALDKIEQVNFARVMDAFRAEQVAVRHFAPTTGYGYGDDGRDTLERIYARIFGCEDALVRPAIASGTHALALCLYGLLRPGDILIAGSGKPYDTLESVIGLTDEVGQGSLKDYGIEYRQVDLKDNDVDVEELLRHLDEPRVRVVALQRSRGYDWRPSLSVKRLGEVAKAVHEKRPDVVVMVDNCYGEFVQTIEPTHVGCDIIVGSLIKNPGGGLAPVGGYIAGTEHCIENAAYRLTSPGLGKEVGATLGVNQSFFQGLFLAPTVTASALKGAILAANVYESLGFPVVPNGTESRHDIIQAVTFGKAEGVIEFCKGIQAAAPVDSYVTPEPWAMPGYDSDVIMAAGAFVQGSSIELSADGPIKPPYAVYFQGGLTYPHAKLGILMSLEKLVEAGIVTLP